MSTQYIIVNTSKHPTFRGRYWTGLSWTLLVSNARKFDSENDALYAARNLEGPHEGKYEVWKYSDTSL